MKILKVKIKKRRTAGECHFEYPSNWNSQKIHVLAYEDNPNNLGEVEEDCLCVTDEETAEKLLESRRCKEINKGQANAFGRKWRPQAVYIRDYAQVASLVSKLLKGGKLSPKERRALDLNDPEEGINRKKEFDIERFL